MSFSHTQTRLSIALVAGVAAAAALVASGTHSASNLSEALQQTAPNSTVAFRGSGRLSDRLTVAYRASGRFQSGVGQSVISYRGSERGVEALAYRASGRFQSGVGQSVISYRGSERGVEALA